VNRSKTTGAAAFREKRKADFREGKMRAAYGGNRYSPAHQLANTEHASASTTDPGTC
jgi:hypothetical protein